MKTYTIKKLSVATSKVCQSKRLGVVKLAQDVHAHSIVFCVQEEGQQPKAPRKMNPEEYLEFIRALVTRAEEVYSCYEAGPT